MSENTNPTFKTVDEWFEHQLKTTDFSKISKNIHNLAMYIMECEEFDYRFSLVNNSLLFSCNVRGFCNNDLGLMPQSEILAMFQNKSSKEYKTLFTANFVEFKTTNLAGLCNHCPYTDCPKSVLALYLWLKEKNRLDEYLSAKTFYDGSFSFSWNLKNGVKFVSEKVYTMAKEAVNAKMILITPHLHQDKYVKINTLIDCGDFRLKERADKLIEQVGEIPDFSKSVNLKRTPACELIKGCCTESSCRHAECPIHVAGYLEYMKKIGKWSEIEKDRQYYEENKEKIEAESQRRLKSNLETLHKNKITQSAMEKLQPIKSQVENFDLLVNNVANKYVSNLYCAIEVEEGMDKNKIIQAISDALRVNNKLNDNNGFFIQNKYIGLEDILKISLDSNTLHVVDRIGEFLESGFDKYKAKTALEKTIAFPRKNVFILLVGSKSELSQLFSLDNKVKYLYENMKIKVKELTSDEIFEEYVGRLDSILQDTVIEDKEKYKELFYEFLADNRSAMPFKNIDLAIFAAQYANSKGELILPPSVYKRQTLEESLSEIVGLNSVKKKMTEFEKFVLFINKAKSMNLKIPNQNLHMVFTGNPGTGKTTIARIMAQMLYDIGLTRYNKLVEVERKDLIGQYIGHTAPLVNNVINEALGGVLFIDEAYSLTPDSPRDFGHEAIATLIKAMEDKKDDIVIIFAGYKDEMRKFVDSNPGIKSRIGYTFNFDDYSCEELLMILQKKMSGMGFTIDKKALSEIEKLIMASIKQKNFGNARFVDKLIQETLLKHAQNNISNPSKITAKDIPTLEELNNELIPKNNYKLRFNNIIGLTELKTQISDFATYVQFQKKAKKQGIILPDNNLHMIFTGNSGTGKTMVARLIAQMLFDLDILHENKVVEVSRKDLIGQHVGETAIKTSDIIDKALGGVLFIDEAYSLTQSTYSNDFGHEAIATLIKAMEDHKSDLIVIFAGYEHEMKQFVDSNSGIASRIGYHFHFKDYSPEELTEIYKLKMKQSGFKVTKKAEKQVLQICKYFHRVENLGNGRFIEKLIQQTIMQHAKTKKADVILIEEDVIPTIKDITNLLSTTTQLLDVGRITDESLKRTATHEIGHAYIRYKLFNNPELIKITINAEGVGTLGYVEYKNTGNLTASKEMLLNRIAVSMAGMASEKVFLGEFENGNTSDLENATSIAKNMVTRYGMSDLGFVYMNNANLEDNRIFDAVNKILNDGLQKSIKILQENEEEVNMLINALLSQKELTGEQFMELVKK